MKSLSSQIVMIVDDDDVNRMVLKQAILSCNDNLQITECENGQEALTFLQSLQSDKVLVFLDLNMPIMDGREFIDEWKKVKSHKDALHLEIDIVSAVSKSTSGLRDNIQYIENYFQKPLSLPVIKNRILNYFAPGCTQI